MPGFAEKLEPRHFLGVAHSATGRAWMSRLDARGEAIATAMAQRGLASESLARVLAGRGVGLDAVAAFLSPSLKQDLPDPSSLSDMDTAASRLADAVQRGESIAVFGDYDVDGATSAALLHDVLAAFVPAPVIYIPDRIFEGYGPNPEAVDRLADGGATLIVCVDCGSASHESIARAAMRGVDVIVLDHHQIGADLPPAAALVNPNRQDDLSGQGKLAAVGVTFLAAVALLRELRRRGHPGPYPDLLGFLDLVALGTVCDMVSLSGLNRAYVTKGLVALRHTPRPGLRALIAAARLTGPVDCGHLGFLLGPRINAGGRIGEATLGARLLTTGDAAEAERIAVLLDGLNQERQAIEQAAVAEAMAEAEAEAETAGGAGPAVLVAGREGWHPGVVGLVAARLKERFCRPAFAIAWNDGTGTGSGRSIPGVDIGAAVRAAVQEGILVKGGGHAMAAGLTVELPRLAALRDFLEARLGAAVAAADAERTLEIDGALSAGGASAAFIGDLERAGPFGNGNPAPVFGFPAHRLQHVERVGSGHVRASIESGGASLKCMAFRAAEQPLGEMLLAARGRPLHLAGTLCLDHWNGAARPLLRVLDAALPEQRY